MALGKIVKLARLQAPAATLIWLIVFSTIILDTAAIDVPRHVGIHPSIDDKMTDAYRYVLSRYNPILGLVSESEDRGVNAVGGTTVNNTYWIYSDNLWAAEALKPYNLSIAANINKTIQSYIEKYGKSMLFEAALGEIIPTTIHAGKNIVAYNRTINDTWVQILLDRHQYIDNPEGIFRDADEYADLCFYLTIDYWMLNDTHASEHWFRTGESLWNYSTNNGFYDIVARSNGRYQNMKLGLFLLAKNVTRFQSNITSAVEEAAWSYQNTTNGGITTESWLNGSSIGTANIETTSALLLSYDDELVERLRKQESICETKLQQCKKQIADLKREIKALRYTPWAAEPPPLWFIILVVATGVLSTTSVALFIKSTKIRPNKDVYDGKTRGEKNGQRARVCMHEEICGLECLRSWLAWRLRFWFSCCHGLIVPDDYGYGNEGYRKAQEQFLEGLWKRPLEKRFVI